MLGNWLHLRNLTLYNKKLITLKVRNLETCPFNTIPLTYLCTLCIIFMNTALIVFPLQLLSHDKNFKLHPVCYALMLLTVVIDSNDSVAIIIQQPTSADVL